MLLMQPDQQEIAFELPNSKAIFSVGNFMEHLSIIFSCLYKANFFITVAQTLAYSKISEFQSSGFFKLYNNLIFSWQIGPMLFSKLFERSACIVFLSGF